MATTRTARLLACAGAMLLAACGEEREAPTAVTLDAAVAGVEYSMHDAGPFTFRAPLEPYRIHQLPDFLMHSKETTDIVMQRSVFAPGAGAWHTHPGPSFVYVVEGEIKLERFSDNDGCVETPVFGPGNAYFEVANEVHRAVVVSPTSAVLVVTRFNIPVGGPITVPAADPGC